MSYINGLEIETMTTNDLAALVNDFVSSDISYEIRSRLLFYLGYAFEKKLLSPTSVLTYLVGVSDQILHLNLIAFCLRNGADPNAYVEYSEEDNTPIHVLCSFIYSLSSKGIIEKDFQEFCCLLFLKFGTNVDNPAFKKRYNESAQNLEEILDLDPELKDSYQKLTDTGNIRDYSVQRWLDTQADLEITTFDDLFVNFEGKYFSSQINYQKLFGLYTDIPEYALMDDIIPRFEDLVITRAINTIKAIPLTSDLSFLSHFRGQTIALERCLASVFVEAWEYLLQAGVSPTYFDMSYLLVLLRNSQNDVIIKGFTSMLQIAIVFGVRLDNSQVSYIPTNVWRILEPMYAEQFWKKEGRTYAMMSKSLHKLTVYLSIDLNDSKEEIVAALYDIERSPEQDLIDASERRQKLRFSVELGTVEDFVKGNIPNVVISNRNYVEHSPESYNDLQIAVYHSNNKVYAFASDRYEDLIKSRQNPLTGYLLPDPFIAKLIYLLRTLELKTVHPRKLITFKDALAILKSPDRPDEDEVSKRLRGYVELRGISDEKIIDTSAEDLNDALHLLDMDQTYLSLITNDLFKSSVFYHALEMGIEMYKTDQARIDEFFDNFI